MNARERWEKVHQEQALAIELGLTQKGEWRAEKRGGPVHYWRAMGKHYFMFESECGLRCGIESVGKVRAPGTIKRPCRECRKRLVEFYVQ